MNVFGFILFGVGPFFDHVDVCLAKFEIFSHVFKYFFGSGFLLRFCGTTLVGIRESLFTASRVWTSRLLTQALLAGLEVGLQFSLWHLARAEQLLSKSFFVLLGGLFPGPLAEKRKLFRLFELIGISRVLSFFSSK